VKTKIYFAVLFSFYIFSSSISAADILCVAVNGSLSARSICKKKERQIDPSALQPVTPKGETGLTGETGPRGLIGLTGATGPQGPIGLTGVTGPQGPIGLTGATGPQGPIGLTGATGLQGPIGLTGATGLQGPIGLTGATGLQGPIGLTGVKGAQGPAGLTDNSEQIAISHFNYVNKTGYTYPLPGVRKIAFDGAYIWAVSNKSLTKIDHRSGGVIAVYNVGEQNNDVISDGVSIWISSSSGQSSFSSNYLFKVNPQTGEVIGKYPVGAAPYLMSFDGTNIWCIAPTETDGKLYKVDAVTGNVIGDYTLIGHPADIEYDGTNIWTMSGSIIYRINTKTGTAEDQYKIEAGNLQDLAFDGINIWVSDDESRLFKINPDNGSILNITKLPPYTSPTEVTHYPSIADLLFDGNNIVVLARNFIFRLDPVTGVVIGRSIIGGFGIWTVFDGINLWTSSFSEIYKL
jgi:hypothetical protein